MACKYLTHGPKAAARRATSQAGNAPVAGKAVPRRQRETLKHFRKLRTRSADYALMMGTKNSHGGAQQRKDTGGFHKPGSYN